MCDFMTPDLPKTEVDPAIVEAQKASELAADRERTKQKELALADKKVLTNGGLRSLVSGRGFGGFDRGITRKA